MNTSPTLKKMGVENPEEISTYTLTQVDNTDHLKVIYNREKYSLRPVSKRFIFGRFQNTMVVDSGKSEIENIDEISPHLLKAVAELEQIIQSREKTKLHTQTMKEELIRLEKEIVSNLASVRSIIESIEKDKSSS